MTTIKTAAAELAAARAEVDRLETAIRNHQRTHYEGDDMATPFDRQREEAGKALMAAANAMFAAEWTAEVFAARRAEWNKRAMAAGKNVTMHTVRQWEAELGFRLDELKRAKAMHAA